MKIGSFSLIKELNTSVILNTIRKHKSISRAQIANITGLTPATVTNITAKLLDCRLISETTLGESSGGRKPVMLEINTSEYNAIYPKGTDNKQLRTHNYMSAFSIYSKIYLSNLTFAFFEDKKLKMLILSAFQAQKIFF